VKIGGKLRPAERSTRFCDTYSLTLTYTRTDVIIHQI